MKQVRTIELTHSVPVDGRGKRTRQTELLISGRNRYLVAARRFYPDDMSDREVARRLRSALSIYRGGRWERDRSELTCPPQYRGKLLQMMWLILKSRDAVPSEMTIRRTIRDPRGMVSFDPS